MKQFKFKLKLIGPSGDKEKWTICLKRMKKSTFALTDWKKRTITFNLHKMKRKRVLRGTIIHEAHHVVAGQNGSEKFAINFEKNAQKLLKRILDE